MLGLPRSTEVNRRIAKEKLYANASLTTSVINKIKEQIESIIWRNKLADSTIGAAAGESVKEIQVFEVALRQKALDKQVLPAIAKAIPYKILFVLTYQDEAKACMEISDMFYGTEWFMLEGFMLKFEGLNLNAIYENLTRQISGGRLKGSIAEAVERDRQRQKIEREIAALEKKILREKQFNRQVELNGELKKLKQDLDGLE
jgi:hypothetical protein